MKMEKLCKRCQKPFESKRADTRFCSHSCRQMNYLDHKINLSVNLNEHESSFTSQNEEETSIDVSQKVKEASIDGYQNVKPSIDGSENISKTTSEPSSFPFENVNPSIDTSALSVKSSADKASIDALNEQSNSTETQKKPEYTPFQSTFLNDLADIRGNDNNITILSFIFYEEELIPEVSWVSLRLRCLTECLLTFSEMKFVQLNSLKEACNSFTLIIKSNFFKELPKRYPYTSLILKLREDLKRLCIENEESSELRFRLKIDYKKEIIIARWELANFFPKKNFGELNFKV